MYTLKVPSDLLSYWFSHSNLPQQVVGHAIRRGPAWYAYVPAIFLH